MLFQIFETASAAAAATISPDGKQIAFCYQGDIWTVSAKRGRPSQGYRARGIRL